MAHLFSCCGLSIATQAVPALIFNGTLMEHTSISMPLGLLAITTIIVTTAVYLGRECLQLLQQDQS